MSAEIQNPGSALGEAIGAQMEKALNVLLTNLVEGRGYHFLSKSPIKNKAGTQKKLLMYDKFGTAYNVDAVIANESLQPIILIESKYIRYKKHNCDKGSWLCVAHPAIRRRYASIRRSIAVLAGSWSSSSLAMMKSYDINIFLIPFRAICDLLAHYNIQFDWDEKDRATAIRSWQQYTKLAEEDKAGIGFQMVGLIKNDLEQLVLTILDENIEREIDKVSIELHSNIGEVKAHEFSTVTEAIDFLNDDDLNQIFVSSDSQSLFDAPPVLPDSE